MLIVIAVVSLITLVGGVVYYINADYSNRDLGGIIASLGAVVLLIALGAMIFVGADLATSHIIDDQIALYEQENSIIEEKINLSVSAYLEYEQETLQVLTPENAANFVCLYPELSADSVVQQQITTYLENHNTIVNLKVKKINLSLNRWWLYFGS